MDRFQSSLSVLRGNFLSLTQSCDLRNGPKYGIIGVRNIFNEGDSIKKLTNILFIISGFICLGVGVLGIVLPVIPTTPLLLLASFCFMKGSRKFELWFKSTNLYKKHLEGFVKDKSMTLKQKIFLNLFADSMIAIAFFTTDKWLVRTILICVVLYKYYYFITKIKTVKKVKPVHQ